MFAVGWCLSGTAIKHGTWTHNHITAISNRIWCQAEVQVGPWPVELDPSYYAECYPVDK